MIFFDATNASGWRHSSGLTRVSRRLLAEMGASARAVRWPFAAEGPRAKDWFLTSELFSESERPGFTAFVERRPCRLAAIYHDAIPIKFPDITWPQSVARHPGYMKLLARFDRVWAVSEASRRELVDFWAWQGVGEHPEVGVLPLGADWNGIDRARSPARASGGRVRIVSVGIVEPRKNQGILIEAAEALHREGVDLELHLVGRVNPVRGAEGAARIREASARWPGLVHHRDLKDDVLAGLVRSARATAFASIAEGCGLPVLESLWLGTPCVCADTPAVVENARRGGCMVVEGNGLAGWVQALRRIATDGPFRDSLAREAVERPLPTWAGAAHILLEALA